jgi:DNA-binding Xre family transcriptional regulator
MGKSFLFLGKYLIAIIEAKAIRLSTSEGICTALECQPGDKLKYRRNEETHD